MRMRRGGKAGGPKSAGRLGCRCQSLRKQRGHGCRFDIGLSPESNFPVINIYRQNVGAAFCRI
jgi:hypothetical protein